MESRERRKGWNALAGILATAVLGGCSGGSPTLSANPHVRAGTVTKPVSFAILEDYDKGQDLREVARDFSRFRELGIVQWRGSFGWDDYEPSPGRYDHETGFATTPGKSEKDQAEWWARAVATFLAEPRVEQIGIYEIKDQQLGTEVIGDTPNYYLGLIRRDDSPKLAFETIRLLVRLFHGDSITVADPLLKVRVTAGSAAQLHHHLFIRPDGRQLVFVWDKSGSPTVELTLPAPAGAITGYAIDGRGTPWKNVKGNTIRGIALQQGTVRIFLAEGR
jgi:hypothetical protein